MTCPRPPPGRQNVHRQHLATLAFWRVLRPWAVRQPSPGVALGDRPMSSTTRTSPVREGAVMPASVRLRAAGLGRDTVGIDALAADGLLAIGAAVAHHGCPHSSPRLTRSSSMAVRLVILRRPRRRPNPALVIGRPILPLSQHRSVVLLGTLARDAEPVHDGPAGHASRPDSTKASQRTRASP